MIFLLSPPVNVARILAFVSAISIGLLSSSYAIAEPWQHRISAFADRADGDSEDETSTKLSLQPRFGAELEGERILERESGRRLTYGYTLSTESYPEDHDQDRLRAAVRAEFLSPLRYGILRQIRIGTEITGAWSTSDLVFRRARFTISAKLEPKKGHTLQVRIRTGYRDHNDSILPGFDQSELLLDVMHLWGAMDKSLRTTTIAYYDIRDADYERFSYLEGGIRLIVRQALNENIDLAYGISAHLRNYKDGGRRDKYLRLYAGPKWEVSPGTFVEGWVGVQRNVSTFSSKDYGGGIVGISVSREF